MSPENSLRTWGQARSAILLCGWNTKERAKVCGDVREEKEEEVLN